MNPLGMWTSLRSNVESYLAVLGPRFARLIWVAAIGGMIWVFGPRLAYGDFAPLTTARARLITIGVILLIWAVWALVSWWRSRRADAALASGVAESPETRAATETREEIAELRKRLRDAMKMMRKVVGRRFGYAYEYPWYLMMGAPGTGKTTLVMNSGFKFPLGDALRAEPVQGVGGTRNCNWWFTDRAILIDTAGRYTTQESGHERDSAGFLGFLSMLRRRRRAQPVNGVILTLSLTDLLTQNPEARLREVRAVRQRLAEIEGSLGARIPIYLVLTKADRLSGFAPFFETLGAQGREQVWGMTFPADAAAVRGRAADLFSTEYRGLLERLNTMLLERLQQETDIERRGAIFRFPAQVAALHAALREIVEELCSGNEKVAEPFIRGVYFTSATQEDTARRTSAIPQPASAMNRSFFVNRLFADLILGEAALVGRDMRVSRRRKIMTGIAYGTLAAGVLLLTGSWISGYSYTRQAMAAADTELVRYSELVDTIPVRDIDDADFLRLLPALNTLSSLPEALQPNPAAIPLHKIALGMDRTSRIAENHANAYSEALGKLLLPRYMVALQTRLKTPGLSEADAFETLKHYLSLAGLGPIDPDALLAQSEVIFAELYPGSGREATRQALQQHMVAMLERGDLPILAIDDLLVAETRDRVRSRSPAQRVLDLLATLPETRAIPDWSVTAVLGPAASNAFQRSSGAELDQPIDGLLTRAGYQTVVLPRIAEMAEAAAGENWVRGPGAAVSATPSEISSGAIELYWAAFSDTWRDNLGDVTIRPVSSLADATELVAVVSSEADPFERLAEGIAAATNLAGPAALPDGVAEDPPPDPAEATPGLPFDPLAAPDPYGALRRALEVKGEGEEAANALTPLGPILDEAYQQLGRVAATDARAAEVFAAGSQLTAAAQNLAAAGRRLPGPVDAWTVGLAGQIAAAAAAEARVSVDALWQAEGARECRRAVEGRYPFATAAESEVTIDDFTRIFGPEGLFATFFDGNLAEFVDVSTDPWSWKGGLGTSGQSSDALAQFQRAAAIRTAFFPTGAERPRVEVTIQPRQLDPSVKTVIIRFGDIQSTYREQLPENRTLVWPSEGSNDASISVLPGRNGLRPLERVGTWAPFRLLDQGEATPVSDNQLDVAFAIDGRDIVLRITSGSVNNPFRLDALKEFRCPDRL